MVSTTPLQKQPPLFKDKTRCIILFPGDPGMRTLEKDDKTRSFIDRYTYILYANRAQQHLADNFKDQMLLRLYSIPAVALLLTQSEMNTALEASQEYTSVNHQTRYASIFLASWESEEVEGHHDFEACGAWSSRRKRDCPEARLDVAMCMCIPHCAYTPYEMKMFYRGRIQKKRPLAECDPIVKTHNPSMDTFLQSIKWWVDFRPPVQGQRGAAAGMYYEDDDVAHQRDREQPALRRKIAPKTNVIVNDGPFQPPKQKGVDVQGPR